MISLTSIKTKFLNLSSTLSLNIINPLGEKEFIQLCKSKIFFFFLCKDLSKAGLWIGMVYMGFFVCLGFPFGGERGSFEQSSKFRMKVSGVNLWYLSYQEEWLSPPQSGEWKHQGIQMSPRVLH